jgi:hypothetical protein
LMLTSGRNPQVAFAQARIEESRAQLDRAESLWLPSLRAGANYNKHEGRIQDVAGQVIETSRGSAYGGLGASRRSRLSSRPRSSGPVSCHRRSVPATDSPANHSSSQRRRASCHK